MSRPSDYSDEMVDAICGKIAAGESLLAICQADDMPDKATVFRWLERHETFRDKYARAREWQAEGEADEIVVIADTDPDPARARVRIDARKWRASKLRPKVYGDKVTNEHTGPGGGVFQVVTIDPSTLSDAQLKAIAGVAITK